ncbi:hypothetical protein [Stieleria marina]|uniref:Uncharacterized protein n=1 Tax=Stieleria marina TaxID=1930275 RepID=A0A517P162_9BACT|nr:hypothetical protein K239x_51270 [Planctomycetes bacterium K23_9]
MTQIPSGDSSRQWFLRGFAAGVMLMAAFNAASYFIRSAKWNSLAGVRSDSNESIGFPWLMWEGGNAYGGFYVDYPVLGLNVLAAIAVGILAGGVVACCTRRLNSLLSIYLNESQPTQKRPFQFSLWGMMIATTLVAVIAMLATRFAAHRETLIAIYVLGPLVLVAIAMIPGRLSWQTRVWVIIPTTLGLIAAAIGVGLNLRIDFDRVLLAIFLCWTPQSAIAALLLTAWLIWSAARSQRRAQSCDEGGVVVATSEMPA